MKITIKSNFTFSKVKGGRLSDLIFNNVINPIGSEAHKKVKKAFSGKGRGIDIYGESYKKLNDKYAEAKIDAGKPDQTMVYDGGLKGSIRYNTNKRENKSTVFSNMKKGYGVKHLIGFDPDNPNQTVPIRKWFFTEEELPIIFKDDRLLKDVFDNAFSKFEKKLLSQLKTKMRKISSITLK
jgi:hypothetical protein